MPNADVLRVLSGISSVLGLLSCLAYFFVLLLSKRAERSIRTTIDNTEPLLKADHIIRLIAKFKTDEARLQALERLLDWDRRTAEAFLSKVKGDVNVLELVSLEHQHDLSWLLMVGLIFLAIGVLGLLAQPKTPAQNTAAAPADSGNSAATTDSGASSLEDSQYNAQPNDRKSTNATTDFVGSSASSSEVENSPSVPDGLELYKGNANMIPKVPDGAGNWIIDPKLWPRGVEYISLEGCGGGGGGAGAGRARSDQGDYNQGPSGAGGAGSELVTYTYHLPVNGKVPIEFQGDGHGGCGGYSYHATCTAVPEGKNAPSEGEPGHKGVTVIVGRSLRFEGGEPGQVVPGWDWSKGHPTVQAPGGRLFTPGGNGGTHNIGMPTAGGATTQDYPGGMVGGVHIGSGGFAGAGGGSSLKGKGGDGGTAGSGTTTAAANDAKSGGPGGYCGGGGGGGSAAGGGFPGGNGGDGGPPWLKITVISSKKSPGR